MLYEVGLSAMANMGKFLALLVRMSEVTALRPDDVKYKSEITEGEIKLKLLQAMYDALEGKESDNDDKESSDKNKS